MILTNTETLLCTVRYCYSSPFFSFYLTSITLTHSEGIVCVDMAMDTLMAHWTHTRFLHWRVSSIYLNFHYLHRQHTAWFRKQLRTFTCKSIKIIAPILLVCIELNPGPQRCYLCRKSIKTNDHKLIQCDHCSNWIHRNCCNIDDSEYGQLVHSSCSWACPECNHFNFSNYFFDDTKILTSNQFDALDNVNQIKTKNPQPSKN